VVMGEARFLDPHTIRVDGRELRGETIIVAAGSAPVVPPIAGRELGVTSDELLFLPELPASLVLVGAGAIGLELASAFGDLGSAVTVVGLESEILTGFDADIAQYLRRELEARGVTFALDAKVTALSGARGNLVTRFEQRGQAREVRSSLVGLTVGRRFEPRLVGAEALGLA